MTEQQHQDEPDGSDRPVPSPGRTTSDLLVRTGGLLFVAGFAALLGVLPAGSGSTADVLLAVAMVLVPLGFCVSAAGLLVQVNARVRDSRARGRTSPPAA